MSTSDAPKAIHPLGSEKVYRRVYAPEWHSQVHLVHPGQPVAQRLPALLRCPREDSNLGPTA
jgi:hypothetical protein